MSRFADLERMNRQFFSALHRARVTDVQVSKGTVSVIVEGTDLVISDVLMPLMALSLPPKPVDSSGDIIESFNNGGLAAWGRYIAQVGDILLLGFDTNAEAYAIGYHAVTYSGMADKDQAMADKGGIGWGAASDIRLEPGDWDFFSRRNSRLMLTDKAVLYSGPHRLLLDKTTGTSTLSTALFRLQYGAASEQRRGEVRRQVLPTDTEESAIPGMFGSTAQESRELVKRGSLVIPGGQVMVETAKGEVIDEKTFLPLVPVTAYPELSMVPGVATRRLVATKDDATGKVDLYVELIDNLGNRGVSSKLASAMQWFTPAATWTIQSASVAWTNAVQFKVTTPIFNISAPLIQLGGTMAISQVVKGTELVTALTTMSSTITSALAVGVGDPVKNAAVITAMAQALILLTVQVSGTALSKGTFTQ